MKDAIFQKNLSRVARNTPFHYTRGRRIGTDGADRATDFIGGVGLSLSATGERENNVIIV